MHFSNCWCHWSDYIKLTLNQPGVQCEHMKSLVYDNKVSSWGELQHNNLLEYAVINHTQGGWGPSEIPVAPLVYAMIVHQPLHSCSTLYCRASRVNTSFITMTTETKEEFPQFLLLTGETINIYTISIDIFIVPEWPLCLPPPVTHSLTFILPILTQHLLMLSDYAAGDAQSVWEASVKDQYNILVTTF